MARRLRFGMVIAFPRREGWRLCWPTHWLDLQGQLLAPAYVIGNGELSGSFAERRCTSWSTLTAATTTMTAGSAAARGIDRQHGQSGDRV